MIPVVIESPYQEADGRTVEQHLRYLDACIRWCVANGYTPYASHKMLTTALDDRIPEQRKTGIEAGIEMAKSIKLVFFFRDYGMSNGMKLAAEEYDKHPEINVKHFLLPYGTEW